MKDAVPGKIVDVDRKGPPIGIATRRDSDLLANNGCPVQIPGGVEGPGRVLELN